MIHIINLIENIIIAHINILSSIKEYKANIFLNIAVIFRVDYFSTEKFTI